jgi:hypothetical protein
MPENTKRKFENLCYNLFIQPNCFLNYDALKHFILGDKILMLDLLLTFSRTTFSLVLLWIMLIFMSPLSILETFPPLASVMSQDLAANDICKSLDIFSKPKISLKDAFRSA